ncbi:MAG TPA: hypothetical protein DCY88_19015 [Cyanobacteria bacterium UBA11372]|nr:hypothetical protein [Cyanobacteria bacterium UBA11372]HBE52025.1 hypothetical protein [Cyanobacteria bacterium UBA11369]
MTKNKANFAWVLDSIFPEVIMTKKFLVLASCPLAKGMVGIEQYPPKSLFIGKNSGSITR